MKENNKTQFNTKRSKRVPKGPFCFFAWILKGSPFLSVPINEALDILNWFVTISLIFIADIGVHNNCLVNKEPAISDAIITRPHPVKKNCH